MYELGSPLSATEETLEQLTQRILLIGKCIEYMQYDLKWYIEPEMKVSFFDYLSEFNLGELVNLYTAREYEKHFTFTKKKEKSEYD